jgi:hypothetical protein
MTEPIESTDPNPYSVRVQSGEQGWEVHIVGPTARIAWTRHCADEAEARTFASTVQQHIYWLSPAKFAEYYKLAEPA